MYTSNSIEKFTKKATRSNTTTKQYKGSDKKRARADKNTFKYSAWA